MVLNASSSPSRDSDSPPELNSQGVYKRIATWRRQQTLTSAQIDPVKYSAIRRENYRTGKASTA